MNNESIRQEWSNNLQDMYMITITEQSEQTEFPKFRKSMQIKQSVESPIGSVESEVVLVSAAKGPGSQANNSKQNALNKLSFTKVQLSDVKAQGTGLPPSGSIRQHQSSSKSPISRPESRDQLNSGAKKSKLASFFESKNSATKSAQKKRTSFLEEVKRDLTPVRIFELNKITNKLDKALKDL